MKKLLSKGCMLGFLVSLTSCYTSTFTVGELDPTEPLVCVNTVKAPHYLEGLVKENKTKAEECVGDIKNYKVKYSVEFADALFSSLSFGLYTPTTVKYFVPADLADRAPKYVQKDLPQFGIRAGGNMLLGKGENWHHIFSSDDKVKSNGIDFHAGIVFDIPVGKNFYIESGASYLRTPGKGDDNDYKEIEEDLQVPIMLQYRYPLINGLDLVGTAGPAFNWLGLDEWGVSFLLNAGVLYKKHYYAGITYDQFVASNASFYKGNKLRFSIGYNF